MEGKKKQKLTAEEKKILKEQKKIEKKLQAEEAKRQRKRVIENRFQHKTRFVLSMT